MQELFLSIKLLLQNNGVLSLKGKLMKEKIYSMKMKVLDDVWEYLQINFNKYI